MEMNCPCCGVPTEEKFFVWMHQTIPKPQAKGACILCKGIYYQWNIFGELLILEESTFYWVKDLCLPSMFILAQMRRYAILTVPVN